MTLYKHALEEKARIKKALKSINNQLKHLPKENFFCSRSGNYYKWYKTTGKQQIYIPKKDRALAEKYATKRYLSEVRQELLQEEFALNQYLEYHQSPENSPKLLIHPEYQNLLAPYFQISSQEQSNWAEQNYEHNPHYPEHLIHKASSGILVRSKSEVFIDMALYANKIPFRYECALQLGSSVVYPDFTILHPKTGELLYWEHCGLIDDPQYMQRTYSKIQLYASHGIYQTFNLITTFETQNHPFNFEQAEKIVKEYFL